MELHFAREPIICKTSGKICSFVDFMHPSITWRHNFFISDGYDLYAINYSLHYLTAIKQVRVTNLEDAAEHIGEVLKRVKKEHLVRAYKISDWYGF